MHGEQNLGLVLEHVRRPQRAVDARAAILELRGQAAVDNVDTAQDCIALRHRRLLPSFWLLASSL